MVAKDPSSAFDSAIFEMSKRILGAAVDTSEMGVGMRDGGLD